VAKYIWDRKIPLSSLNEQIAWLIFKGIRWNALAKPRCIYCGGRTKIHTTQKGRMQRFFRCKICLKTFSDLTGTPFSGTKLSLYKLLLLTVLIHERTPINRTYRLLKIDKKTAFRYAPRIRQSALCRLISERLNKGMGITREQVIMYLNPNLAHEMKYRKAYVPITQYKDKQEDQKCPCCGKHSVRSHPQEKNRLACRNCNAELDLQSKRVIKGPRYLNWNS
jgi:transposase-like protein